MGQWHIEIEAARSFLCALDPSEGPHIFQVFPDAGSGTPAILCGDLGRLLENPPRDLLVANTNGCGVFVTINQTDGTGRKRDNILGLRAVFCDFDDIEPGAGSGALPPSMIVQSKNGKHVYWLIAPNEELSRWSGIQLAMAQKLGADPACHDLSRVMRVPGFWHRKDPDDPFMVELLECHPERRYTLDQITNAYDLSISPPKPPQVYEPSDEDGGVADEFRIQGDWSFLEKHGWIRTASYGSETRWCRPGKTRGTSATTDHEDHEGIFYCFSSNAAPFDSNQGYTRFQAYGLLEHGGDLSLAARDLIDQGYGEASRVAFAKRKAKERDDALWDSREGDSSDVGVDPLNGEEQPPQDIPEPIWTDIEKTPEVEKKEKKKRGRKKTHRALRDGERAHFDGEGGMDAMRDSAVSFVVEKIEIYQTKESDDADPIFYWYFLDHTLQDPDDEANQQPWPLCMEYEDFETPKRFKKNYAKRYTKRGPPMVPNDIDEWDSLLRGWLAHAVERDESLESSRLGMLRAQISEIISRLPLGEEEEDLDRGRVLAHPDPDKKMFCAKQSKLWDILNNTHHPTIKENQFGTQLTRMGIEGKRVTFASKQVRVRLFPAEMREEHTDEPPPTDNLLDLAQRRQRG